MAKPTVLQMPTMLVCSPRVQPSRSGTLRPAQREGQNAESGGRTAAHCEHPRPCRYLSCVPISPSFVFQLASIAGPSTFHHNVSSDDDSDNSDVFYTPNTSPRVSANIDHILDAGPYRESSCVIVPELSVSIASAHDDFYGLRRSLLVSPVTSTTSLHSSCSTSSVSDTAPSTFSWDGYSDNTPLAQQPHCHCPIATSLSPTQPCPCPCPCPSPHCHPCAAFAADLHNPSGRKTSSGCYIS